LSPLNNDMKKQLSFILNSLQKGLYLTW
jgi:hypothetical protein